MAKFFNLLTGLAAKKYAPQPPEIDYKPPEVYRVEPPVDGPQDDLASLSSEYCDPEDLVRGRDRVHSECEYSVPCDELPAVYYSSVPKDVSAGERGSSVAEGPQSVSGLYHVSPNLLHQPNISFASAGEAHISPVTRDVSLGSQQPHASRPSASSGDNEDYDCPWDQGDIESQIFRMVQERQSSRTSDSSEREACDIGRLADGGRSVSVSSSASWSSAQQFISGHGGDLASPSLQAGVGRGEGTAAAGHIEEPAYSDSSPCASVLHQLAVSNTGYFVEGDDFDPSREIRATVPSSNTAKADCRKPIALPRNERVRPQPSSRQCYVNLTPIGLSAPPSRALPSPAAASPGPEPLHSQSKDDPSAGVYDDPWDMQKLEEALLAGDPQLLSSSAGFGTASGKATLPHDRHDFGTSGKGVSIESEHWEHSAAEVASSSRQVRGGQHALAHEQESGVEARGRRALSEAGDDDDKPVGEGAGGLHSSRSVLALAATFGGSAQPAGPPRSSPLFRSTSSCGIDQSPSGQASGPAPVAAAAIVPLLGDASITDSLKRSRPAAAAARAVAGVNGCSAGPSLPSVAVTPSCPSASLARMIVTEKLPARSDLTSSAHAAATLTSSTAAVAAAGASSAKAGVAGGGCASKTGSAGVRTKMSNEASLSTRSPADATALGLPVMVPDRRGEAAAGVGTAAVAVPSPLSWRKGGAAGADQDEAGTGRWRPTAPSTGPHSRPTIDAESAGDVRALRAAVPELPPNSSLATSSYGGPKFGQAAVLSPPEKTATAVPPVEKKHALRPLMQQRWFHEDITRQKAEELLANEPDGSFLVRMSSTGNQEYSLSFRVPALGVIHLKITSTADGAYILGQFSQPFKSMVDLIDYYSNNLVPLRNAEHVKLGKAITRQQR